MDLKKSGKISKNFNQMMKKLMMIKEGKKMMKNLGDKWSKLQEGINKIINLPKFKSKLNLRKLKENKKEYRAL